MARRDERQRADDQDREQQQIERGPSGESAPAVRSATRRRALRARGFARHLARRPGANRAADQSQRRRGQRAVAIGSRASRGVAAERLRMPAEELLDDSILERVEADHGETSADREQGGTSRSSVNDNSASS